LAFSEVKHLKQNLAIEQHDKLPDANHRKMSCKSVKKEKAEKTIQKVVECPLEICNKNIDQK